MAGKLTRGAYEQLVSQDIEWLRQQPRTLERDHVIAIVEQSIDLHYGQSTLVREKLRALDLADTMTKIAAIPEMSIEERDAFRVVARVLGEAGHRG